MRIVAGRHRGRALVAPAGLAVRPTGERAREAIFSILEAGRLAGGNAVREAAVLDAFAGSGALGLEALSRGAASVIFMEKDKVALAALKANIAKLDEGGRARVIAADCCRPPAAAGLAALPATLVLLDPPYGEGLAARALEALSAAGWLAPGALVVV
ncbi:MAG: 16S rRNA (guanine(966)-N(2))-methyltransferase RsmD, partial [Kiloniellales bacterium]